MKRFVKRGSKVCFSETVAKKSLKDNPNDMSALLFFLTEERRKGTRLAELYETLIKRAAQLLALSTQMQEKWLGYTESTKQGEEEAEDYYEKHIVPFYDKKSHLVSQFSNDLGNFAREWRKQGMPNITLGGSFSFLQGFVNREPKKESWERRKSKILEEIPLWMQKEIESLA